ncbi:MAG: hypothetical protein WC026_09250 [Hyphomicrobium sp.]|uniref:hypothetical protein n=1 Tax=Hyphomicrobium sp. TaxID=82 RepID=UPI0035626A17
MEELSAGFVVELPAAVPGSIIKRCALGADGSSLFCSTGDGEMLAGVSEEPVAFWPVVLVDGEGAVLSVGFAAPGDTVVFGLVTVWAAADVVTIANATATE